MTNTTQFDSSLYPRTYTASFGKKFIISFMGLILAWLVYVFLNKVAGFSIEGILASIPLCMIIYISVSRTYAKVILNADSIEYRGIGTRVKVDLKNIVGKERLGLYRKNLPVIRYNDSEFKDDRGLDKTLPLALNIKKDEAWNSWINRIQDIDEEQDNKFISNIKLNAKLGSDIESRKANLANANKIATLTKFCFLFILVIPFYSFAYLFHYSVLMQSLALFNISKYGFYFETLKHKSPFVVNMFALIISAVFSSWYVTSPQISGFMLSSDSEGKSMLIGALFGLPLTYIILKGCSGAHKIFTFLVVPAFFLMEVLFGSAIALKINTTFDTSITAKYNAKVSPVSGKYEVLLSPWGSEKEETKVRVNNEIYDDIWGKQEVCIELNSGFLGIEWYRMKLQKCEKE